MNYTKKQNYRYLYLEVFFWFVSVFCLPLLLIYFLIRAIKGRGAVGLFQKITGIVQKEKDENFIIHGVSLGEVSLMKLIREPLEEILSKKAISTTTTTTGHESIKKQTENWRFFPLDLSWAVNTFIKRVNPKAVILMELEIWPQFLLACYRKNIPVILINARIGTNSFKGYYRFKKLLKPVFKSIKLSLAQNDLWKDRLETVGLKNVCSSGSMKADLVTPADEETKNKMIKKLSLNEKEKILLIASTSSPEEKTIISQLKECNLNEWRIIICPRHPERGKEIAKMLKEFGYESDFSKDNDSINNDAIIIVNEIGCLNALYKIADISFVGGSFGSGRHGQNMLESVAAKTCTIVGKDTRNFPGAMALLKTHNGIIEIENDEITNIFQKLSKDKSIREKYGNDGYKAWKSDLGTTEKILEIIKNKEII